MREQYRRLQPFILSGLLVYNLVDALVDPTRGNWLSVAIVALVLALVLWRRGQTNDTADPPETSGSPRKRP